MVQPDHVLGKYRAEVLAGTGIVGILFVVVRELITL